MKSVLITGSNSYVGNSLDNWIREFYFDKFIVEKISLRDETWINKDFSQYDVIVHLAGIVHQKENTKVTNMHYKINRDLTYDLAIKAKKCGVKHFVFFSTLSVYGELVGSIDKNTVPNPKNPYGKSKLEGENLLNSLDSDDFLVQIVRPPMIYGENCTGNYKKLSIVLNRTPFFFDFDNMRSMIYIDNLCEFIVKSIQNECKGIYIPQNKEFVATKEIYTNIKKSSGKKVVLFKIFNPILNFLISYSKILQKIFGNLTFALEDSQYGFDYAIYSNKNSIEKTEKGTNYGKK